MATAVQLAQGNGFARSAEGGQVADSATRVFKVLLSAPNETWSIPDVCGVNIGDPYGAGSDIPCVSYEARADGESRLVRIVTFRYKSSPGFSTDGGDPKKQAPEIRPALYSMSTSLQEISAWGGRSVTSGVSGEWKPVHNPVGDLVDGVVKLEPIITINVDQYSYSDGSQYLEYAGYVNSDSFNFSALAIEPHQCMLQSVASTAIVEQFGETTFRGFKVSFSFGVRRHYTLTREGPQGVGWDMAVPQTGLNIVNKGLGNSNVDIQALCLEHRDGKVYEPNAPTLAANTENKKVRGMISIPGTDGSYIQRPCAQPIALNDDGTPRNTLTQSPKVLINRICLQPERAFGNNFSAFGIRWIN